MGTLTIFYFLSILFFKYHDLEANREFAETKTNVFAIVYKKKYKIELLNYIRININYKSYLSM